MARAKKNEEQPKDSASLQISIEDFVRTRDSSVLSRSSPRNINITSRFNLNMPSDLITVVLRAKSTMAQESSRYLTREGAEGALRSVNLLTRPFCNVCEITFDLVTVIMHGAHNSNQAHLTITPQVVTGLATLQSAVQDLSRAYIAHTNTVIGKGTGSSLELLNFANPLGGENGLFSGGRMATPAPVVEQSEVKKRKRAPHDKNAPKRPVTPYFLYMKYAREGIAREMGSGATAKQVADEGTRRWNTMDKEEKERWAELYGCNYAAYKKKIQAYKAGLPIPEFTTEEAKQLYEEQRQAGASSAPAHDALSDHDAKSDSDAESDESSSDEEPPPPPKVISPPKSPRASKRGKGAKEKAEKKVSSVDKPQPIERSTTSPEVDRKKKSSKKRDAKAMDEIVEPKKSSQIDVGSSSIKTKKDGDSKQKRKKRKSEATDV
ncbi:MAG: hypothetical protein Q9181_006164 [Wetmoreana brouardii]